MNFNFTWFENFLRYIHATMHRVNIKEIFIHPAGTGIGLGCVVTIMNMNFRSTLRFHFPAILRQFQVSQYLSLIIGCSPFENIFCKILKFIPARPPGRKLKKNFIPVNSIHDHFYMDQVIVRMGGRESIFHITKVHKDCIYPDTPHL